MKENNYFLTHKILPILSIFLLVVFLLCTSVFASTDVTFSDDTFVTLPDFPEGMKSDYFIFYVTSSAIGNRYYLFTYNSSDGQLYCSNKNAGSFVFLDSYNNLSNSLDIYYVNESNLNTATGFSFVNTSSSFNLGGSIGIYYSTKNILGTTGKSAPFTPSDTLVFQGAPQVEEVPKVELMKATQVEEIPQQIVGVVMIVLPIFLAIFGVLLVLYLIKSKNLLQL